MTGYTWAYWAGILYTVEAYQAYIATEHINMQSTYNVTVVAAPSPVYNCHNYAWRTGSGQTSAWMSDPSPYWGPNGGYSSGYAAVGSRAFYADVPSTAKNDEHSAIITAIPTLGSSDTYARSKWGQLGVYNHAVWDCPYSGARTYYN